MKNYIPVFEKFEEAFDNFKKEQEPTKQRGSIHEIIHELIELAKQYTDSAIGVGGIDYTNEAGLRSLQRKLVDLVASSEGPQIGEDFAHESDQLLAGYSRLMEKKVNREASNFKDLKNGKLKGDSKEDLKKSKLFKKTENIPDNGIKLDIDTKAKVLNQTTSSKTVKKIKVK